MQCKILTSIRIFPSFVNSNPQYYLSSDIHSEPRANSYSTPNLCHRSCKRIRTNERKNTIFCTNLFAFRCLKRASGLKSFNIWVRNYLFLKTIHYFRGSCFNVLYYHQLSIACYQVNFYASIYFHYLPMCPVPLNAPTNFIV